MGLNYKNFVPDLVNFIDGPAFTGVFLFIGEVYKVFAVKIFS